MAHFMANVSAGINDSSLNATNSSECPFPHYMTLMAKIQPPFLWFIFMLAAIENIFVLSVFCFHKSSCTVAEIYLGNLAAADLILSCSLPFWAMNIANRFNWPFGEFLCRTVNCLVSMNLYSSICFLMLVSVDRYLALVKTMSLGRLRRVRGAKTYSVLIWLCSLLLSSPMIVFRKLNYLENEGILACVINYPSKNWEIFTNTLLNMVGFLLPLCVIGFCSAQIIRVLQHNEMQKFKEIQTEKKATVLVLSVLLLFVICWLPFQISTFLDTLFRLKIITGCSVDMAIDIFTQVGTYMAYSNSFLNPLVYVIVGKRFRKKSKEVYRRLLKMGRCTGDGNQLENSMGTLRTSISMDIQNHKQPG
ncbi:B2 bradykinin receptor [Ornithorhynchus anatinus]|uniref:B2 bradykinin receptor n=1 Tax=Ornithorhynchus anatinus TaxID=9258 RepID=UPI000155CBA8|nr:B2 bradykinin receptor [Ornithorhynchus anatinus]